MKKRNMIFRDPGTPQETVTETTANTAENQESPATENQEGEKATEETQAAE